ncbi:hypothetical protein JCM19232_3615 [Vibrio ishigakensis]|uniref:Arginine repressor DNA-binding domain-containing protein n=1 Tax=Vibrio ishigakensis TaxID=1481914 RepID=A0A0B8P1W8_9VIBR|nr:hypothetical protein JCM19231_1347 [Vibrio ishigakensis]GAM60673.1 hypothetical protein JCM19232_3615 [Vibrio ishigakensis]
MDTLIADRTTKNEEKKLAHVCKQLLQEQSFHNQNQLRATLEERGFEGISQSTVSRLLCQLGGESA